MNRWRGLLLIGGALGIMVASGLVSRHWARSMTGAGTGMVSMLDALDIGSLELRVKTDGRRHANTDNSVYLQLTSRTRDRFYLDNPGNDRERNRIDRYGVAVEAIQKFSDITRLKIGKHGNDGWCIKRIELFANGMPNPIFRHQFSSCYWIDGNDGHPSSIYFSGNCIRGLSRCHGQSHARWEPDLNMLSNPPAGISNQDLRMMIAGPVGHELHSSSAYWGRRYGSKYVEVTRRGGSRSKTANVDLDMAYSMAAKDPWIDVDFRVTFDCVDRRFTTDMSHFKVRHGGGGWVYWLGRVFSTIVSVVTFGLVDLFPATAPGIGGGAGGYESPIGCPKKIYFNRSSYLVFEGPWFQQSSDR